MNRTHSFDLLRSKTIYLAAFGVALLVAAGRAIAGWKGNSVMSDDAYYYVITAKNFLLSGRFTFDGMHETNGFHPLWMGIVILLVRLAGTEYDPLTLLSLVNGTESAFFLLTVGISAWAAYRLYKEQHPFLGGFFVLMMALLYPGVHGKFFMGLETALETSLLTFALYAVTRNRIGWLAISLPLLFLSRLDTFVFIIIPLLFYYYFVQPVDMKKKILLTVPATAALLIYMAYNYLKWGYWTPISGLLKSSFPKPTLRLSFFLDPILYSYHAQHIYTWLLTTNITTLTMLWGLTFILFAAQKNTLQRDKQICLFMGIGALQILNLIGFQKWNKGIELWYLASPSIVILFTFGLILQNWMTERIKWFVGFCAVAVVGIGFLYHLKADAVIASQERNYNVHELEEFIFAHTQKNDIFAASDCGRFAFWTGRTFINLDGLINNYEYQKILNEQHLLKYLKENHVSYLVAHACKSAQKHTYRPTEPMYEYSMNPPAFNGKDYNFQYKIYSYLYHRFSETIVLGPQQEIWRASEVMPVGTTEGKWIIFDLRLVGGE